MNFNYNYLYTIYNNLFSIFYSYFKNIIFIEFFEKLMWFIQPLISQFFINLLVVKHVIQE